MQRFHHVPLSLQLSVASNRPTTNQFTVNLHVQYKVKVKFSHTHCRALGLELILVHRQSALRWLYKSCQAIGCHYFLQGLWSPSQLKNITVLRPVPSYTAWWQRNIGVNNLWSLQAKNVKTTSLSCTVCCSYIWRGCRARLLLHNNAIKV